MDISNLPPDAVRLILFVLPYEDIIRFSQTSSRFLRIIINESFWRLKYLIDYGAEIRRRSPQRLYPQRRSPQHLTSNKLRESYDRYLDRYDQENPCRPYKSHYDNPHHCLKTWILRGNYANYLFFRNFIDSQRTPWMDLINWSIAGGNHQILIDLLSYHRLNLSDLVRLIETSLTKQPSFASILLDRLVDVIKTNPLDSRNFYIMGNHNLIQYWAAETGNITIYHRMVTEFGASNFTYSLIGAIQFQRLKMIDHILTSSHLLEFEKILFEAGKYRYLPLIERLSSHSRISNALNIALSGSLSPSGVFHTSDEDLLSFVSKLINLGAKPTSDLILNIFEDSIPETIPIVKYLLPLISDINWRSLASVLIKNCSRKYFKEFIPQWTVKEIAIFMITNGSIQDQTINLDVFPIEDLNKLLLVSIENGNEYAFRNLLEAGANNWVDALLRVANTSGDIEMAQEIIKRDVNLEITPLILLEAADAAINPDSGEIRNIDLLLYLVNNGVNPQPILEKAIDNHDSEIIEVLIPKLG